MNKLTVLMYHGIVGTEAIKDQDARDVGAQIYDVRSQDFLTQMQFLKQSNLLVKTLQSKGQVDSPKVIITFDDGEMNNFTEALPILKQFDFQAYFFIIARRVGTQGYMGLNELKKLVDAKMIVGSHGMSHEILTNLKNSQIEEELLASKKYLERNLNISIEDLSIPRGFCNDKVIRMAQRNGYKNIFISDRPRHLMSTSAIPRTAVKGNWNMHRFQMALRGEVPFKEKLSSAAKGIVQGVVGEGGYNYIRSGIIKILK